MITKAFYEKVTPKLNKELPLIESVYDFLTKLPIGSKVSVSDNIQRLEEINKQQMSPARRHEKIRASKKLGKYAEDCQVFVMKHDKLKLLVGDRIIILDNDFNHDGRTNAAIVLRKKDVVIRISAIKEVDVDGESHE